MHSQIGPLHAGIDFSKVKNWILTATMECIAYNCGTQCICPLITQHVSYRGSFSLCAYVSNHQVFARIEDGRSMIAFLSSNLSNIIISRFPSSSLFLTLE